MGVLVVVVVEEAGEEEEAEEEEGSVDEAVAVVIVVVVLMEGVEVEAEVLGLQAVTHSSSRALRVLVDCKQL